MGDQVAPRLGKYQLVARLATGGMAEIYLARQAVGGTFSRLVVVKRILPHLAEEPRFIQMFLEEARLASQIHHTNVVQIYDVDQHEESYYIAMEYIDGLSLGAICRRGRRQGILPPFDVAAETVAQACDGLHAAHELCDETGQPLGLVHRDVSPHNLMIARDGLIKVVDFGIAKAKTTAIRTRTGDIKGKYPYMSPEQVQAQELDRRSDIFSLGAILAELLLGRRLFERESELATLKAITEDRIALMSELDPRVPGPLSDVVAKALARPREARFSTAAEMGAEIRAVMERLGARTSPKTLARYLQVECADLLEARSRAIKGVDQGSTPSWSTVPRVEGFDESESSRASRDAADELDLTRPMKSTVRSHAAAKAKRRSRRRPIVALAVGLAGVVAVSIAIAVVLFRGPTVPPGPTLHYAHPPTHSPDHVRKGLEPLANYLQQKLNRRVDVVVTKNYATLKTDLIDGKVHFANLSPLLFVETRHEAPDVVPLVLHTYEGARTYQSYLITAMDSGINSPEDLRGRRFCYVDTGSTSGYLLPRQLLRSKGLDPDRIFSEVVFSGTHERVMRDVVSGRCEAGAVYSGAFSSAQDLGIAASNLRLFAVAGQTPWDVICASPKLPRATAEALRKALLEFRPERDLGRKIVSDLFRIDGFVAPSFEDFGPIDIAAREEGLLSP
jgi:eukaryotic-like serine/threonine-protein kinase